jgi:hypothetical protein
MEVPHKDYLIKPSAREDALGQWMPVVSVHLLPRSRGAAGLSWPPHTVVGERHKTQEQAQHRTVEIANQMIDEGKFKASQSRPQRP